MGQLPSSWIWLILVTTQLIMETVGIFPVFYDMTLTSGELCLMMWLWDDSVDVEYPWDL